MKRTPLILVLLTVLALVAAACGGGDDGGGGGSSEGAQGRDAEVDAFLAALPLSIDDGDRLYVHANAWAPGEWSYISNPLAAAKSIAATRQRITFCGHVHDPALYYSQPEGGVRHFAPSPGVAMPLIDTRRWLALPGSVGQPRDGNPAACCALFDTATNTLTTLRVAYDHDAAARKIVAAGLPDMLAKRLVEGC